MIGIGLSIIALIVAIIALAISLIERRPWPCLVTVRNVLRDMRIDALLGRAPRRHAYPPPTRHPLTVVRGSVNGSQPSAAGITVEQIEAHPPQAGSAAVPLSTRVERGAREAGGVR